MKGQFRLMDRLRKLEEPVLPLPLVELWGDHRVLIERHGGVMDYGTDKITVRVRYGSLCVLGAGLKLCRMCAQQLVITGKIASVILNKEEET